tara:strand:- start:336 stop:1181 length:846 start_codon:yes stop_codon:yes gene_type:complete
MKKNNDTLLIALKYEGIYGATKAGFDDRSQDVATEEQLSDRQVEQLESVLAGGRAFFFNNWISEYNRAGCAEALQKMQDGKHPEMVFGDPEEKLLNALLDYSEVNNLGFYLDENKRLCGVQSMRISHFTRFIRLLNVFFRRQFVEKFPKLRKEQSEAVKSSLSRESIDLLEQALKEDYDFLVHEGNLLSVQFPVAKLDYERVEEEMQENLPEGVRLDFRKGVATLEMGQLGDGKVVLRKKYFAGYYRNALKYIKSKHPKLLHKSKAVEVISLQFLSGVLAD